MNRLKNIFLNFFRYLLAKNNDNWLHKSLLFICNDDLGIVVINKLFITTPRIMTVGNCLYMTFLIVVNVHFYSSANKYHFITYVILYYIIISII